MSHRSSVPLALILYNVLALASPAAAQNLYPRPEFTFPAPYTSANDPQSRGFIETRDGDFVGWVSRPGTGYGCDTIASINRSTRVLTALHALDLQSEGCEARPLVEGRDGSFYGVTTSGGPYGFGTVFRLTPDGAFTVVHAFAGGAIEGPPAGPLMLASNGNLYGTTMRRGNGACCPPLPPSTIFTVSESGAFTTVAIISNVIVNLPNTAVSAEGPLFQASDGRIYGTTTVGPGSTVGSIYRLELDGSLTVVHAFASWSESDQDGVLPRTGVIQAADGNFYGTTSSGGAYRRGTVFRMTPAGDLTTLSSLQSNVWLPLVEGANGFMYGSSNFGTFSVSPGGRMLPLLPFGSVPMLKSRDGRMWGVYATGLFSIADGPSVLSSIDSPRPGENVTDPFVVTGWAFDLSRPVNDVDTVHVWAFPDDGRSPIFVGASGYGSPRPDVAERYNVPTNTGFGLTVRNLTPGTYRLVAYAYSGEWDGFDRRAPASVTVTVRDVVASSPRIHMDTLAHRGSVPESFSIRGWAIDLAAADTTGVDAVHVYAYPNWNVSSSPTFLGTAVYGGSRADIGASFGPTFTNSAFDLRASLPDGPYTVVAFAHSTVTGLYTADAREIFVRPPGDPQMALDAPANGATVSQPFLVGGWSIDRDASNGSGVDAVHVWAYPKTGAAPIFLGPATYGAFRYDVSVSIDPVATQRCVFEDPANARTICPFGFSSFGLQVDALSAGTYDVVAFAHSTVTGRFSAQRQATVTVH